MSATQPAPAAGFSIPAGGNRLADKLYVVGNDVTVKIASQDTGGAFAGCEDATPPLAGPPLHLHLDQDEWWYILEGEYLFEVDGQQIKASAGATVFARRGSRHTFQNIGEKPGRTLVTVVPGGLDVFFKELSAMFPAGAELNMEKMAALFRKYNLELLGPPIAAR
jgi:mannose-6-phosphate isomerase-like protein (cupin superfamily)